MESSTNLGRVSLVPRGAWDPAASYTRLDVVEHEGASFLVLRDVRGAVPQDGEDYMLLAAKGNKGDKGDTGDTGPKGNTGDTGAQGPKGDPGSSIAKIERTAGTGAAGTVDTYTVTLTDGSTAQFQVRNGADGKGAGDMLSGVYDPQGRAQDVYAYADALLPVIRVLTLTADGWTGAAAPYTQTASVPGVLADEAAQAVRILPANYAVWAKAGATCTGQGEGTLIFTAAEKTDILLRVAVQTVRKGADGG